MSLRCRPKGRALVREPGLHRHAAAVVRRGVSVVVDVLGAQTLENPPVDTHGSVNLSSSGSGSGNNGIRRFHLPVASPRRRGCLSTLSSALRLLLSNPPFIRPDYSISTALPKSGGVECEQDTRCFKAHE